MGAQTEPWSHFPNIWSGHQQNKSLSLAIYGTWNLLLWGWKDLLYPAARDAGLESLCHSLEIRDGDGRCV